MADEMKIQVVGLKELQKALRDIERDLPKELAAGLAEVSEMVLVKARALVPRGKTGNAQESMKVRKQQRGASIAVGGTKAPYYPWLDFGGRVGRRRSVKRTFIQGGRYIYPTLKVMRPQVNAKVDEVVRRLSTQAGFDTTGDVAK